MKSAMPGEPTLPPAVPPRRGWALRRWPPFHEFGEALSPHTITLSLYAVVVGILAGLVAVGLLRLIFFLTGVFFYGQFSYANWQPLHHHLGAWVILIPLIAAIPVGWMIYAWEPTLRGHGIPEAMESVLIHKSMVRKRVAILKPLGTALVIGAGGPFGAEGPIIQTGGALGSMLAQWLRLSVYDRRVLLAAGAGAGMAATFKAPFAGVLVAIELIVFEFRARSFIPIVLACAIADGISIYFRGSGPMFPAPLYRLQHVQELWLFALLGLICGLIGWGMTKSLFGLEKLFARLPLKPVAAWAPVVGALILGVIGYFFPRVFGTSYDTIGQMLNGQLTAAALLRVATAKFWALVISLGSGTTGGVFAPSLVVGGGVGAAFAIGWQALLPHVTLSAPAFYGLAAMAAVFGAIARAPFTAVIFLFELGHNPSAVLPLLVCVIMADGTMRLFSADSMMTQKLAARGLIVSQDYVAPQLELWSTEIQDLLREQPEAHDLNTIFRTQSYIEVKPSESVAVVAHALLEQKVEYAVIRGGSPPHALGVVSVTDILALEDEVLKARDARQRARA